MQRQFPEFPPSALEFLKSEIAKASNKCADTADGLPDMLADYIRESNS
ncbi:protein convertase [Escherichia coli O128:H2 str. 2011C-3317]|nr:protein convertase [Escherichia coli O128:H2 str. 2011C-3317]